VYAAAAVPHPLHTHPRLSPAPASRPRSCTALQELRLNHNQLRALPADLASNTRLRILDCGGNRIASFDDIQVGSGRGGGRLQAKLPRLRHALGAQGTVRS